MGASREIVWEILRHDERRDTYAFTMKEFYVRHVHELGAALGPLMPGASIEGMVKGALRSLAKKGLIQMTKSRGDVTYEKNIYLPRSVLLPFSYSQAVVLARRMLIF